ncbi:hypothetical protein [Brucella pituitosa]|uniref:hypothetical protein n=1 Tax=Brucella pituitosa TaxID=571256 RepID=UPI003F4A9A2A
MKQGSKQKRHCGQIALIKARQARRKHYNLFSIGLIFIAALFPLRSLFSFGGNKHNHNTANDWPISDYERGHSTQPKPIKPRYGKQPTFKTIMRDLKRPAARDDATKALMEVIHDDDLRDWILEQVRCENFNRLSVHVRSNQSSSDVILAWRNAFSDEHPDDLEPVKEDGPVIQILSQ